MLKRSGRKKSPASLYTRAFPKILITAASTTSLDFHDQGSNGTSDLPQDEGTSDVPQAEEDTTDLPQAGGFRPNAVTVYYPGCSPEEVARLALLHQPALDGGWGWVVLAGCFCVAASSHGIPACFEVLFHKTLQLMGMSPGGLEGVHMLHVCLFYLCSAVTPALCRHLDWRLVGCSASLLMAVAFMLMALALSPFHVVFLFTIIGCSSGVAATTCFLVLPAYFQERRGVATAVFLTGMPVGQTAAPVLAKFIKYEFGLKWGTLLVGSFLLHCCLACAVFRPMRRQAFDAANNMESGSRTERLTERTTPLLDSALESNGLDPPEKRRVRGVRCGTGSDILRSCWANLKGLKTSRMFLATFGLAFLTVAQMNFVALVQVAMGPKGHSPRDASLAVLAVNITNIVSRILMLSAVDKSWLGHRRVFIVATLIASATCFVFPLVLDKLSLVHVCLVLWSTAVAVAGSVTLMLLIQALGLHRYESAVTAMSLLAAITSVTAGPIIGVMRDAASSCLFSIHVCAAMQLSAALMWLFIPDKKRPKRSRRNLNTRWTSRNHLRGTPRSGSVY